MEGSNPIVTNFSPRWIIDEDPNYTGANDRFLCLLSNRLSGICAFD